MHTIKRLILDLIFISTCLCVFGLQAENTSGSNVSSVMSQEMCIDEMFQVSGTGDQSVLRTFYTDNGLEVKYEVVVSVTGDAFILKDNITKVKLLSYKSGDYFSAQLKPSVIEIYQNSSLIYSQNYTSTIVNKNTSAIIENKLYPLTLDYSEGFCGGNTKCVSSSWGNAGFVSKNVLKQSEDGEIKWVVQEVNKYKMLGLGAYSISKHYRDIKYAIYQAKNQLRIYESGVYKASGLNLKIGDVLQVKKVNNGVKYYLNDRLIYSSKVSVTEDLHILSSLHTSGGLIQNVQATFTENHQLYTTATVVEYSNQLKWNRLKHYAYSNVYKSTVSTSRTPSALSENFYQANLGHKRSVVKPDLSELFKAKNKGREVNAIIGIKAFETGDYINENITLDRILCGISFVGKGGKQQAYIIEDGRVVGEIPGYEENDVYKIILEDDHIEIAKEVRGKDQIYYGRGIDPSVKHVIYQGSEYLNSPFLSVRVEGFNDAGFVKFNYQYDGQDGLLKKYDGKIQDVIDETGQSEITHQIGWYKHTNIKGFNPKSTVRKALSQNDTKTVATAETAFRFKPKDAFKVSFIYSGGEYAIGSKTLLSSAISSFNSGFNISRGKIYLVNNGSNTNSVSIASGANVTMLFPGNGTMILRVNGSNVGGSVSLPSAVLNLGMNLNQGSFPAAMTATAAAPPPVPTQMTFATPITSFIQDDYNVNCAPSNMTFYLNPDAFMSGLYNIRIRELNTFGVVEDFDINVVPTGGGFVTYQHQFSNPLEPGVYMFEFNGAFEYLIEIMVPSFWDDDLSNPDINNVSFDMNTYINSAESSLSLISSGTGSSVAKNTISLPNSFSVKFPIEFNGYGVIHMVTTGGFNISYEFQYDPGNGVLLSNPINNSNLLIPAEGFVTIDYFHTGGNQYREYCYFTPYSNPFVKELVWQNSGMTIPGGQLRVFTAFEDISLNGSTMSFCEENSGPYLTDKKLKFASCGSTYVGDFINHKDGYDPNIGSCPMFDLEFVISNLQPNTFYRLERNMFVYNTSTSDYDPYFGTILTHANLGSWWYTGSTSFTSDANGNSPFTLVLRDITSQQLFNQPLYIMVKSISGDVHYIKLDFSVEDEAVNEVYRECFNYNISSYDCFFSEFGIIDQERNYSLAQPQSGAGEIDYDWYYATGYPGTGGVRYDLQTGCYTVSLTHDPMCALPQKTIAHHLMARADWPNSSGISYLSNGAFNGNQYKEAKLILSGNGSINSLNKSPSNYISRVNYRHLYPDQPRDIGVILDGDITTTSDDFKLLAHIEAEDPITGLAEVFFQIVVNGVAQSMVATNIKLKRYEFLDLIFNPVTSNTINVQIMKSTEFSNSPGNADTQIGVIYSQNNINVPNNGGIAYQAHVRHFNSSTKTSNLSLNFCVEPVEVYTAFLQRTLHDGRHEVATCISEDGNPECRIPIFGPCEFPSGMDILYFKFDEDYLRHIGNLENLDFEIYDHENVMVLDNTSNQIVNVGDNRYGINVSILDSDDMFYVLIVKNAKGEKRYLRFKKP